LALFGCGAARVGQRVDTRPGLEGAGLVFGLVVMVVIYATGHLSGAHINPAVTVAFAALGRFRWGQVPTYVMAQAVGALLAAFLLGQLGSEPSSLGATTLHPSLSWAGGLVIEIILTFVLMFVIVSVATDARAVGELAGLAIGSTVALAALVAGPLTGALMNPARSLGPALISGTGLDLLPLYFLGPVVGAILGALTYQWIRCHRDDAPDVSGCC
jgi:aquaporin NIP